MVRIWGDPRGGKVRYLGPEKPEQDGGALEICILCFVITEDV